MGKIIKGGAHQLHILEELRLLMSFGLYQLHLRLCKTTGLTYESYSKNLLFLSKDTTVPPNLDTFILQYQYMKTPFNCEFTPPNHTSL